jgi:hypothetical protein
MKGQDDRLFDSSPRSFTQRLTKITSLLFRNSVYNTHRLSAGEGGGVKVVNLTGLLAAPKGLTQVTRVAIMKPFTRI